MSTTAPASDKFDRVWLKAWIWLGSLLLLYATCLFVAQLLGWLASAVWQPVHLSLLLYGCEQRGFWEATPSPPVFDLIPCRDTLYVYKEARLKGLDVLLQWIGNLPLGFCLLVGGTWIVIAAVNALEMLDRVERKRRTDSLR